MTLPISFATQTITRLRAPLVENADAYGNDVFDWASADALDLDGCSVQPLALAEVHDGQARDTVQRRWLVIAPPGVDIIATDRATYAGSTYDVDGEPLIYATGVLDHVELFLVDVRG
jgi:hypothetical protein